MARRQNLEDVQHKNLETARRQNLETAQRQNLETAQRQNLETAQRQNLETTQRQTLDLAAAYRGAAVALRRPMDASESTALHMDASGQPSAGHIEGDRQTRRSLEPALRP
jgi:DNA-binding TFAR19-related protein (PDSD5 family)